MARNHVVGGGGISGLVAALLLAQRKDGAGVIVVEAESDVGGLLRSFDYGEHGRFDYGTHLMAETGEPDLDRLLFGLLEEHEWEILEGARRDLAGLFFNGRLQSNSIYMDLRSLPPADLAKCVEGLHGAIDQNEVPASASAHEYAVARFGGPIAELAVAPAVRKLFGLDARLMDTMATMLTSMERVILFDEEPFLAMMGSDPIRARVAFPEQRKLPQRWASGRRSYYPRHFGMHRVIDALSGRLNRLGVTVLTQARIKQVECTGSRVEGITLEQEKKAIRLDDIASLYWTIGLPGLIPLLGLQPRHDGLDKPLKTVVVNLLLDRPPDMGDLYYFYCYDPGFRTFRVTHYSNYCSGATRNGAYPICVELLIGDDPAPDPLELEQSAITELSGFGIMPDGARVLFSRAAVLASGFPMPSLRNIRFLDQVRALVRERGIDNLHMLGIFSEPRLFFQRDVMVHTYQSLTRGMT